MGAIIIISAIELRTNPIIGFVSQWSNEIAEKSSLDSYNCETLHTDPGHMTPPQHWPHLPVQV